MRATGFRIDLAGSIDGDLIVSIQTAPPRLAELAEIVAAHDGRIEIQPQARPASAPDRAELTAFPVGSVEPGRSV
jgi:hypothetical protein